MVVPTPVTWSTWTVMARLAGGTSMLRIVPAGRLAERLAAIELGVGDDGLADRPARGPGETSPKAVALRPSMRQVDRLDLVGGDRGAERDVGGRDDGRLRGSAVSSAVVWPGGQSTAMNATIARKTPMSRTKRLERFK